MQFPLNNAMIIYSASLLFLAYHLDNIGLYEDIANAAWHLLYNLCFSRGG